MDLILTLWVSLSAALVLGYSQRIGLSPIVGGASNLDLY